MKIEMLTNQGIWICACFSSKQSLLSVYSKATLVTETNEWKYYATNDSSATLFKIEKPERMTRRDAEKKYGITILG
jgi:hypothetical protein